MLADPWRLPRQLGPLASIAELQGQSRQADEWSAAQGGQCRGEQGAAGEQMGIRGQIIGAVDARARHLSGLAILEDAAQAKSRQPPGKLGNEPLALGGARRVRRQPLVAAQVAKAKLFAKPLPMTVG